MNFVIKRKVLISMLFVGITLLGYFSYKQLQIELYPNAELPMLFVQVGSPVEVDPKYMESKAVIPLEGAIGTLEGIEKIESSVSSQQGIISVRFKKTINFNYSYLKLQEKITQIKSSLPANFYVEVTKIDMSMFSGEFMELQLRGSGGEDRLRNLAEKKIKPEIENIDGVASVNIFGGRQKSIEILLNSKACNAYNITPSKVREAVAQGSAGRTFIGKVYEANQRYFVHISAEYNQISEIESIVVAPGPVLLKDVATIFYGLKEQDNLNRVNGQNSVSILIDNDNQSNLIELSGRLKNTIEQLNQKYKPRGIEVTIQKNSADQLEKNINKIINLALTGALLAVFVLWIFLKNLKLVALIGISIPISIFAAFNFFYAFNITINTITLVGIALDVGMLVDNSIVVLENIYRLKSLKLPVNLAVTQGTSEVWRSIFASTLTTLAIFLPFIFSDAYLIKLLGKNIGVSVVSTLAVSLFTALLLVPSVTHSFLSGEKKEGVYQKVSIRNRVIQIYIVLLKSCMRRPVATIILGLTVFFLSAFLSLMVSTNSLSEVENKNIRLYGSFPSGTTLAKADITTGNIEKKLAGVKEIKDLSVWITKERVIVNIDLNEDFEKINKKDYSEVKRKVVDELGSVSGVEISESETSYGGGGGGDFGGMESMSEDFMALLGIGSNQERIIIKGQDFDRMKSLAEDIRYQLKNLKSIDQTNINVQNNRPEVHLQFKRMLMTEFGIPLYNVANELNTFSSQLSANAKFKQGEDEYEIVIREDKDLENQNQDKTIHDLKNLQIADEKQGLHQIDEISDVFYSEGLPNIHRKNQENQIVITYSFVSGASKSKDVLESYRKEVDILAAKNGKIPGIAIEVEHEKSLTAPFKFLIIASILVIFMIMASVFESFLSPLVMMFTIPLAAIGSLLALVFTGSSLLNANTLTGFMILIGIVVNNGIILIDYTEILRRRGFRQSRALLTAGISRVRPILITAITTIVGMIPLAMGKEEYVAALGAPFAITVIGGLTVSTLLTLVFIPTLYFGMNNALNWIKNLPFTIKIADLILLISGLVLIYFRKDGILWSLLEGVILFILIPGITFFIISSLRRASTNLVQHDESINIKLRSIVKIYDRESRFTREWKAGEKIRNRLGISKKYRSIINFDDFIWLIPLYVFFVYFTFIYLNHRLWTFILAHVVFMLQYLLWNPVKDYLTYRFESSGKKIYKLSVLILDKFLFWGVPALFLFLIQIKWEVTALTIVIGVFWFLLLIIYSTSKKIYTEKINIERITGKFGALRRAYFRIVQSIPIIGKRRKPFKALKGVCFDIGPGMFGLLGPNGAGKTTIMRIICGIIDQNYGKIWINGIETLEKREELQGLIGYLPQEFGAYENMTANEYLDYQAIMKGISNPLTRNRRVDFVLEAVHMSDKRNDRIGSYSGGMKQRIGIAQILLHLPRILVVDEPTAGLDPRERIRFRNLLVELSRERVVIFSTHIIEDIASSCNQVAVINKGELCYLGHPREMAKKGNGLVWQYKLSVDEFEKIEDRKSVVHHMRDGDQISIRCISQTKPSENAEQVTPRLEDAYLCLLRNF